MEKVEPEEPWFGEGLRFQCTGCGKCCTGGPGCVYLSSDDLNRLAEHFHLPPKEFAKKYTRLVDGQYALLDKPGSYDCIFLEEKKCSVYESRPVQCKTFPWWLENLKSIEDWEEAAKRCEGINHPDAPLIPSLHIEIQCATHLDNLLEQNFSF